MASDELPNIGLEDWFNEALGGFPHIKTIFPGQLDQHVQRHPVIGKRPNLVFVGALVTYAGIDLGKIYWYKFSRLYHIQKFPIVKDERGNSKKEGVGLSLLKIEDDWDKNLELKVPKLEKPDWDFYLSKSHIKNSVGK